MDEGLFGPPTPFACLSNREAGSVRNPAQLILPGSTVGMWTSLLVQDGEDSVKRLTRGAWREFFHESVQKVRLYRLWREWAASS